MQMASKMGMGLDTWLEKANAADWGEAVGNTIAGLGAAEVGGELAGIGSIIGGFSTKPIYPELSGSSSRWRRFINSFKVEETKSIFGENRLVLGKDLKVRKAALNTEFEPGNFQVFAHGCTKGYAWIDGTPYTAQSFAKLMFARGYKTGTPVTLFICYSGDNGFAFQLKYLLNAPYVMAPNTRIACLPGGIIEFTSVPKSGGPGKFIKF